MVSTRPAKVFLTVSIVMFILITLHIALNLYRLLRGFILLREVVTPHDYFLDLGRWDNVAHDLINAITTWLADFLVIYRCFLVWNNNYYVVILPALMVCMSIVANAVALHLFTRVPYGTIFGPELVHWMNTIYSLAFAQNSITTGLIAYKIWRQDRRSVAAGITSGEKTSLIPVVRIVVESAAIYLLELLVLIILYALKHNAQFILQEAVVPTVGIVFTLMTVRIALRSSKTLMTTARAQGTTQPHIAFHWASADSESKATSGQVTSDATGELESTFKAAAGMDDLCSRSAVHPTQSLQNP
ncbi:hypothetical protein MD484_g1612, partial [Candolleomyces efflorescens]